MEITTIVELVTKAGAGLLTVVLCIATYTLWKKLESEQEYSRKRDEDTIKLLTVISSTLNNTSTAVETTRTSLLAEVTKLRELIMDHILDALDPEEKHGKTRL